MLPQGVEDEVQFDEYGTERQYAGQRRCGERVFVPILRRENTKKIFLDEKTL